MSATTTEPTYCRICEAACGLLLERDAAGVPLRLLPDKAHPVSRGYLCAKGSRFLETVNHPRRLRQPMRREATGRLTPVSWESALEDAAARLNPIIRRHGPHAVAVYYGNPMLFNALGLVTLLRFNRVLGTRNVYSSFSQDCNNKFAAAARIHGGELIHPIPDVERADLALMLGSNPAVSQGSFVHLDGGGSAFDRFAARGGRSFWVDPRRSESAARWGEHIPIRPGSDVVLLLALLHVLGPGAPADGQVSGLAEILSLAAAFPPPRAATLTGIPEARIHALADALRDAPAATFHMSVGVNQGPFGSLAYVALQALAFVSGNFDAPGGLIFHPLGPRLSQLLHRLGIGTHPAPSRIGGHVGVFDELPGGILADEILTPGPEQVRALIVVGGNPLQSIPGGGRLRQALESLEFQIHVDLFANATAQTADLLLPATGWLERWDVATTSGVFQTAGFLPYGGPLLAPPGEARSERQILSDLATALGRPLLRSRRLDRWWRQADLDRGLTRLLDLLTLPLRRGRAARGLPIPRPRPGRYLGRGPLTPDRRVHFWHPDFDAEAARLQRWAAAQESAPPAGGTNPRQLTLICRRRRLAHNSWLHGGLPDGPPDARAWLAPADAADLGIEKGTWIDVGNQWGRIRLTAHPRADVQPGTIVIPHGLPDSNVNALLPSGSDHVEPFSGNHVMGGFTVAVTIQEEDA